MVFFIVKMEKILLLAPTNYSEEKIIVPETVKIIGEGAFNNNITIKKIVLSNNVEIISQFAFYNCKNLEEINLDKVDDIGQRAFYGCEKFEEIRLSAKTIGKRSIFRLL